MIERLARTTAATVKAVSRNLRNVKFEPEVAYLRFIIRGDDICLHIGASDGRHSYVMSKLAPNGRVYCFEPSAFSFAVLRGAVFCHRLKNVKCINAAVSDVDGFTRLITPVKTSGRIGTSFAFISQTSPTSKRPRTEIQANDVTIEDVRSITIDDYCVEEDIDRVDFIRCDVEGAEMKVVNGAIKTIEKNNPTILLEIHPISLKENFASSGDLLKDFFLSRGYRMFCLDDGGLMEVTAVRNEPWRDYFFVHPVRGNTLPSGPFLEALRNQGGQR